jgi:hypothetical protein
MSFFAAKMKQLPEHIAAQAVGILWMGSSMWGSIHIHLFEYLLIEEQSIIFIRFQS